MDECSGAITYETAGLEPYTYRCMLQPGHGGPHYHQTIGGGMAWCTPRGWR